MFIPTALLLPHTVGLLDVMHHSGSASWELPIKSKPEKNPLARTLHVHCKKKKKKKAKIQDEMTA